MNSTHELLHANVTGAYAQSKLGDRPVGAFLSLSLSSLCLLFIYSIPTEKLYAATCTTPKNNIMQIQLGEEKVEELIVK